MLCTLPLPLSSPVRCFGLSGYIWGSLKLYGMINPLFCLNSTPQPSTFFLFQLIKFMIIFQINM